MLKVLSTKLKVEEIDRFTEMAEQQGLHYFSAKS